MGLYDITISNAIGGNNLSFNKEQKKRTETDYLLKNEYSFLAVYSLNRNQK
jgi:hypothetical protein